MKFAIVDTGKNAINVYMYLKDKYSVVQTYVGFDLNRVRQHTHNAMEKNDIVEEFTWEEWNDICDS